MKKIIVLALTLMLCTSAFSQFYVGPRAGINLANMSNDNAAYTNNSIIGIMGGAEVRYQFSNYMSVQMDALFSQQGTESTLSTITGTTTIETKTKLQMDYLHIPLMINYEIPLRKKRLVPYRMDPGSTSLHLYGGGYIGYALGGTQTISIKTIPTGGSITETPAVAGDLADDTYNKIDFGLTFGAGISFTLTDRSQLFLDARYNLGLADVNNFTDAPDPSPVVKNTPLSISLGYMFKLTKKQHIRYTW